MPQLIHGTSTELEGLWFLDKESLLALDSVLDGEWERLLGSKSKHIQDELRIDRARAKHMGRYEGKSPEEKKAITRELRQRIESSYPFNRDKRKLLVHFKKEKKVEAARFSEVVDELSLQDDVPVSFEISMTCGRVETEVKMGGLFQKNSVRITCTPEGEDSLAFRERLKEWFRSKAGPRWQSVWVKHWWIAWLVLFLSLWIVPLLATATSFSPKEQLKAEARRLLRDGVNQANEPRAVELTLAILSDYSPQEPPHTGSVPASQIGPSKQGYR
jgi:hypothetical protein